ncbi:MAG TPA: PKD domain-containing protein [Burkholderiaceae bacterium]|nr:PKD domain-containing protein [Burkholderiaceae bacterium]HMZ15746.1 PKD domain-containing protein [Mycobacterium sp.]HNB44472.1 PKD domain-containing protein [Burkholderiaceae bacterium]HNG80208.1 PKD domain-containing protein [Burkholderiaceae bacterium]
MSFLSKALAAGLAAVAASVLAAGSAKPVVPYVAKGPFPVLRLPDAVSKGQRAVDLLGANLPAVAAWYRKSPDEFISLLLNDVRLRIDSRGRLFAVDELTAPLAARAKTSTTTATATVAAAGSTGLLDGALAPLDQTFLLHSKPGAQRTIYLNFKGATLVGTGWNSNGNTITALPYDTDGVPGTFSTAELQSIQYIWQRVAEDFAPFDVDVTTEAVAADLINRASSSDAVYGTTVLITNSNGVYTCSCGGVAYIGVFDDVGDFYKPALVFYNQLGGGYEKYVAEAISHEAGHNIGLQHDGTSTVGYYQGQGSGATGWAPIMGVGYYQALVQWSKGEYYDANNTQDDFAVAQTYGLPLRIDDHGDTPATATVITGTSSGGVTTFATQGVIERSTDVDVFSFSAAAGPVTLTLSPAARSANLDGTLTLTDSIGTVLASANPVDALNASITATLPAAGTYYVAVRGTGNGDPAGTGYSSYGSVGQYALSGNFYTPGNVAPTAALTATPTSGTAPLTVNFSGTGSTDPDGTIASWAWTFGDGGSGSGATVSHVYSVAGSYTAVLQVTDNAGMTASKSTTITVGAPPMAMGVSNIAMSLTVAKTGTATAKAAVTVLDANGRVVPGATVTGNWSGLVSKTGATATTSTTGVASFTSPTSAKNVKGTFTFTVTGVTKSGYSYLSASNLETSDSIIR